MHGVRRALVDAQADALGLPLDVVELPWPCPNDTYEELMGAAVGRARSSGVDAIVFGDLFLDDIRRYREQMLDGSGVEPLFPLWQQPTDVVAGRLLALGVRAVVACVDLRQLPRELAGRPYDEAFLADLPAGADPCGENGEFHTVVVDGPGFAQPIDVTVGETVERDGFAYADVIPSP
jgi:diphthamide synthase (EF-2-diphthine--ammonia ligase)